MEVTHKDDKSWVLQEEFWGQLIPIGWLFFTIINKYPVVSVLWLNNQIYQRGDLQVVVWVGQLSPTVLHLYSESDMIQIWSDLNLSFCQTSEQERHPKLWKFKTFFMEAI